MVSKAHLNLACVALVPFLVSLVGYLLYIEAYFSALLPLVAIIACMETRVRMGYRSRRGGLFIAHLACALVFILTLIALASLSRAGNLPSVWLLVAAYATFAGMVLSGAVLIRRSWRSIDLSARVV